MKTDSRQQKVRIFLGSFATLYGIGYLSYIVSPIVIGSVIDGLNLNEGEAGVIATSELLLLALTIIFLAPQMATMPRRKLSLIGVLLVITGHGLASIAGGFWTLLLARIVAGIGLGTLVAIGNAAIAGSDLPQRLYANVLALGQVLGALMLLFVLPAVTQHWSYHGSYGFLAIWALLLSPLLFFLPESPTLITHAEMSEKVKSSSRVGLFLLPSVLAMVLIGASDASIWTFSERIAVNLGLSSQQAGNVLASALIAGVFGSILAGIIGTRFGERWPILIGSVLLASTYYAVANAQSGLVYSVAQITVIGLYGFLIPFLYGVNGRMDKQGRVMVAGSGAQLIGTAAGPVFAGQAILLVGYSGVGITVFMMTIGCGLMFLIALRSLIKTSAS